MNIVDSSLHLFVGSGAGWVLWLLVALSAAGAAVGLERFWFFRGKSEDLRALASILDAHLARGDSAQALEALRPLGSLGAAVARAGLRLAPRGLAAAEKGMASAVAAERKQLENRLAVLGTLGNNAPFVGLLGTVIGVIGAFEELGKGAVGGAAAGLDVPSQAVMGAIAEALVATAVGIAVALPAVALYNYFQRRITALLDDAEALSNLVLAYLSSDDRTSSRSEHIEPIEERRASTPVRCANSV